jgi:FkbM family methyltransferase
MFRNIRNNRLTPLLRRLRGGNRMTMGVGRGLRFDPGPSNSAYASGNNELPVQEALAACLAPGAVFYDIGANVGFLTVIGAKLVGPDGTVYAFEPVPANVACIRRNIELNRLSNVTLIEKAISAAVGQGELFLTAYSGGGALTTTAKPFDSITTIPVTLASVDQLVFEEKLLPPSVVKVDVEGGEIDVFKGMQRTMEEFHPTILYEVDDGDPDKFQNKYTACESFLSQAGYRVNRLPDSYPNTNWIVGHAVATPIERS